jgi:hypothetical protein
LILESSRRVLKPSERRLLRAKIRHFGRAGRLGSWKPILAGAAIVAILWVWTLAASDASPLVVTMFWVVVGGGITLWVRRDLLKGAAEMGQLAHGLESALKRNLADVFSIHATSHVEFEEVEDEGACYAFQIDDERVVFVVGQEFYQGARFPSHELSLVYPLDEHDRPVDMFIDKKGPRTDPERTISSATKLTLEIPEHLEVRHGRLDTLEMLLVGEGG